MKSEKLVMKGEKGKEKSKQYSVISEQLSVSSRHRFVMNEES